MCIRSTCEKGIPGPHHYICGQPKDGIVHAVCQYCGDEKDYPAGGGVKETRRVKGGVKTSRG